MLNKDKITDYHDNNKNIHSQLLVFVSDNTGVAAETMGLTVLSQFGDYTNAKFETLPFIKTQEDALDYAKTINGWIEDFNEVIVFSTLADIKIRQTFSNELNVPYFDFFNLILPTISKTLSKDISPTIGLRNRDKKQERAVAIDYALAFDDGQKMDFEKADIILLGLSRSGKTPTALWLALHYGLNAANYPLTADDFDKNQLPQCVKDNIQKCVLLLPNAMRLSEIRQERYKNSSYASLDNCKAELRKLHNLPLIGSIPIVDVSNKSVEEIAASALMLTNIHPKGRF